jgi:hypothetical protein
MVRCIDTVRLFPTSGHLDDLVHERPGEGGGEHTERDLVGQPLTLRHLHLPSPWHECEDIPSVALSYGYCD